MITDPDGMNDPEFMGTNIVRGLDFEADILDIKNPYRGMENQSDHDVGIRIIMNVTDMKKLMEQNNDH